MTLPNVTLAPPPPPGPLETKLGGLTAADGRIRRAAFHFMRGATPGQTFAAGVCTIIIEGRALRGQVLSVVLDAFDDNGIKLPGPVNRTFDFVNPPFKVKDGTFTTRAVVGFGGGAIVTVPNVKEDVAAAFRGMVADAVLKEARRLGWQG